MLRIALCEDDPMQIQALTSLISDYQKLRPDLEVHIISFSSGHNLLQNVSTGHTYDVFLLDIVMPGLNGIGLARALRENGEDASLVFLTSSADYALDAFDVNATQYILKPVKEDKLFAILDKIASSLNKEEGRFLVVSTAERMIKLPFTSIILVESINRKFHVYLTNGNKLTSKTMRVPFATAVDVLLRDETFLYAHKSFVLNMAQVNELTASSFIMKNGIEVPVPRRKYTDARAAYLNYLSTFGLNPARGR